jgi:hypothetical protein
MIKTNVLMMSVIPMSDVPILKLTAMIMMIVPLTLAALKLDVTTIISPVTIITLVPMTTVRNQEDVLTPLYNVTTTAHVLTTAAAPAEVVSTNKLTAAILTPVPTTTVTQPSDATT